MDELRAELAADAESGRGKAELVGGGPKGANPALSECSVDLTALAAVGTNL